MGAGIEGALPLPLRARDEAFGERRARCCELKNQCVAASIFPQQPGAADGEASFLLGALSEHDPAVINPLATLQDLLLRERDTDLRPDALDEKIIEDIEAAECFGEERESPDPVEELGSPESRRRRAATPGAWASTRRLACSSQNDGGCVPAAARPPRTRSSIHRSSASRPADMRESRCESRFFSRFSLATRSGAAASSGPFERSPAVVLAARRASQSVTQAGEAGSEGMAPRDKKSRPMACLQGCLRLGQEHFTARAERATPTW